MSIYLIWFFIGMAFFVSELVSPIFILFFFGLGSWLVAIIIAFIPTLTFNQQIIIFSSSSISLLILFRNYIKNIFLGNQNQNKYFNEISKGNSLAVITKTIRPGTFGEIKFKGTFYKAKSDDSNMEIKVDDDVVVIKQGDEQGSFYIVKKIN